MEPYINDGDGGGSTSRPTTARVAKELPGLVPSTPSPPPPPHSNASNSIAAIYVGNKEECNPQPSINARARDHDIASVSDVVIQIEYEDEVRSETLNQNERLEEAAQTAQISNRLSVLAWIKRKFTREAYTPPTQPHDDSETEVPRVFWIREDVGETRAGKSGGEIKERAEPYGNAEWVPVPFNSNETLRVDDVNWERDGDNRTPTTHAQSYVHKLAWIPSTISKSDHGASAGVVPLDTSEVARSIPGHSFFDTFTTKNIQNRIRRLGQQDGGEQTNGRERCAESISSDAHDIPDLAGVVAAGTKKVIRHENCASSTTLIRREAPGERISIGKDENVLILRGNGTPTDDGTVYNAFVIRVNGQCEQQKIRIEPSDRETRVAMTDNDSGVVGSQNLSQGQDAVDKPSFLHEAEVRIQIEDEESSELSDSPIKMYMDAMYYLCASPLKLAGDINSPNLAQKVLFAILSLMSTTYSAQLVKDQILLADREKQKLGFYVNLAYYVNGLLFPMYFRYLACCKPEHIKEITRRRTNRRKKLTMAILTFCIGTSLVSAAYQPVSQMNYHFDDWDIEDMLLLYSRRTSYALFIWSRNNVTNATEALNREYGFGSDYLTPKIIGMGLFGISINVVSTAVANLIRDIPLFCAITLLYQCLDFVSELRKASRENVANLLPKIWEKYNGLRDFSLKIKRLNILFQFLHLDSMLFFSYALFDWLVAGENKSSLLSIICRGTKSVSFYAISAKDAGVNPTFRRWLQTTSRHTNVVFNQDAIPISGKSVVEEITTDPIGLGSNMWFIDTAFFWKFFSYVGSSFFFFVESHEDDKHNDDDD